MCVFFKRVFEPLIRKRNGHARITMQASVPIRTRRPCSFLLIITLLFLTVTLTFGQRGKQNGMNVNQNKRKKPQSSTKVISLAESITRSAKFYQDPKRIKASREQWRKALDEIKDLTLPRGDDKRVKEVSLMQWRMLLDEPIKVQLDIDTNTTTGVSQITSASVDNGVEKVTPRFEGFASWERILQDWADDVQEYVDKIDAENVGGYPLSSWGNPEKATKPTKSDETPHFLSDTKPESDPSHPPKKRDPINLPIPSPAKDGEPVLPHTDLSDKSKRIWIVTTAALPWMTGTAVNPLLRAAYMTKGRKELGGSVTLMVPWLERRQDQERVYGFDKVFDNPEAQEEYVRTWLRDSAKMPQASEDLNIEWYTAWQNKAENSVYSMGDLVAEIPQDEVDICILEEPEHLNWYRAPGDSWTDKFKHVVGIIHTNYFVYAQEQPAAFIRVSASDSVAFAITGCVVTYPYVFIVHFDVLGTRNAFIVFLDVQSTLPSHHKAFWHPWSICSRKGTHRERSWHSWNFFRSRKRGQTENSSLA
jgi:hypothetical protein